MTRFSAILCSLLAAGCFSDPETSATETADSTATTSATASVSGGPGQDGSTAGEPTDSDTTASMDGASSSEDAGSTGDGSGTAGTPELVAECDAYCVGCFAAADYDACYSGCTSALAAVTRENGMACGQAWLDHRGCVADDPSCDLSPETRGPCRFHARNAAAICDGIVSGNCGIHPDQGAGEFEACDGDPSAAGSCPDDVLYQNVGVRPLDCGSLRPFEGCCSPSGDYFYCEPQGGGMTYEECPAP